MIARIELLLGDEPVAHADTQLDYALAEPGGISGTVVVFTADLVCVAHLLHVQPVFSALRNRHLRTSTGTTRVECWSRRRLRKLKIVEATHVTTDERWQDTEMLMPEMSRIELSYGPEQKFALPLAGYPSSEQLAALAMLIPTLRHDIANG